MERLTLPTKQEIFNLVWKHFIEEKNPASYEPALERAHENPCRYRRSGQADDPIRCAVGLLIPDEKYTSDLEGYGVQTVLRAMHIRATCAEAIFLNDLQATHDESARMALDPHSADFPVDFHQELEARLKSFALENGLTLPINEKEVSS